MKTLCIGLILFLSSVAPTFALREYAAVEDEIFSLQKDVVTHVVDALKIETSTGIEGSGNIHMKMKIASPSITGSIAVALDPFSTTSEKNGGNMKGVYSGAVTFAFTTDMLSFQSESGSLAVSGSISFQEEFTHVGNYSYIQLVRIDGNLFSNDPSVQSDLDDMMEKAKENTGKTFQMPSSDLFMAYEIENIPRMLSLLQQYPLFLITKKNKDGSYSLRSHPFTMKKLGWSNTTKDDILTYKHEDGKKQIRLSPRRNMAKNFVILTEKDGSYTLEGKFFDRSRYSNYSGAFLVTHSGFTASFQDKDLILNSHWKDGMFLLDMVFSGAFSDTREHVRVEGTLSPDLTKIYLDLFYQENKVGNIRMTLLGDTVQYVVNLDITRELTHIVFDFIYTSRLRKGDFHIMPPTVYERMDE